MRFLIPVAVTLVIHLVLGWRWDLLGGVVAGWMWIDGGWWRGAASVGAVWLGLVMYTLIVATGPTLELHSVLAGMAGDMPSWSVPLIVVLIGILIGAVGGSIGTRLRILMQRGRASRAANKENTHGLT